MNQVWVIIIVFLAVFTQSLSGFGSALVAMALLPGLVGIGVATPLVAAMAMTVEGCLLLRYRAELNLRAVWRLAIASLAGIPFGMLVLKRIDENTALTILGTIMAGYALYALFKLKPPELKHPVWGFAFGLMAGMLGGAYNTSGPPVVVYGNSQRWLPAEFKSNLQGFFFINSVLVVSGHAVSHNFTQMVINSYLTALPALALGILAGISLDRRINPEAFQKIVLLLLLAMGVRMML